jgi:predicted permease
LREDWFGLLRPALWLLQGVAFFVLLIACANVANLMLVRFSARAKELAMRAALGAGRARIVKQVLVECGLLAGVASAVGIGFAIGVMRLIGQTRFMNGWHGAPPTIDLPVVCLVVLLTLAVGIVLGLLPLISLRKTAALELLRSSGRVGAARDSGRIRNALVIAQIGLAVVLLVGAGLLLRSFQQLLAVDAGFHAAGLLTARVQLPEDQYADAPAQARYYQRVLENLRALPGVAAATYTSSLPFGGHLGTSGYSVEGIDGAGREPMEAQRQSVDEEYFTTMQIDILEGRGFSAGDSAQAPLVAVVDEIFARRHWRDGSALGHRLRLGGAADDAPWVTIVGVAHSVRHRGLAEAPAKEAIYWPYRQHPAAAGMFVVKSTQSPATLAKSIRDAAAAVDASLATFDIKTLEERIQATLADRRTTMILLLAFAALSLLLASVGVYAVLAFVVGQRTGELGVRMAIGARPRDILRLVLGGGMRLIAIGAALGLVGAGAMAQLLRTQLFGISAGDPLTFVVVVAVIAVAALIACWLPARRAARVAPMVALRSE